MHCYSSYTPLPTLELSALPQPHLLLLRQKQQPPVCNIRSETDVQQQRSGWHFGVNPVVSCFFLTYNTIWKCSIGTNLRAHTCSQTHHVKGSKGVLCRAVWFSPVQREPVMSQKTSWSLLLWLRVSPWPLLIFGKRNFDWCPPRETTPIIIILFYLFYL